MSISVSNCGDNATLTVCCDDSEGSNGNGGDSGDNNPNSPGGDNDPNNPGGNKTTPPFDVFPQPNEATVKNECDQANLAYAIIYSHVYALSWLLYLASWVVALGLSYFLSKLAIAGISKLYREGAAVTILKDQRYLANRWFGLTDDKIDEAIALLPEKAAIQKWVPGNVIPYVNGIITKLEGIENTAIVANAIAVSVLAGKVVTIISELPGTVIEQLSIEVLRIEDYKDTIICIIYKASLDEAVSLADMIQDIATELLDTAPSVFVLVENYITMQAFLQAVVSEGTWQYIRNGLPVAIEDDFNKYSDCSECDTPTPPPDPGNPPLITQCYSYSLKVVAYKTVDIGGGASPSAGTSIQPYNKPARVKFPTGVSTYEFDLPIYDSFYSDANATECVPVVGCAVQPPEVIATNYPNYAHTVVDQYGNSWGFVHQLNASRGATVHLEGGKATVTKVGTGTPC